MAEREELLRLAADIVASSTPLNRRCCASSKRRARSGNDPTNGVLPSSSQAGDAGAGAAADGPAACGHSAGRPGRLMPETAPVGCGAGDARRR